MANDIPWYIHLPLFLLFQLPNYIGIAVWQHFYTKTTIYPAWSPARSTNTRTDMRGEFAGILIFSALSGFSHLYACIKILLLPLIIAFDDNELPGTRSPTRSVMFVAPFVTPEWSWKSTYKNACNGMDLWVHLDTPGVRQANEVTFEDRLAGTNFSMVMSPDPVAAGYDAKGLYNFNVTSTGAGAPEWTRVEYNVEFGWYTIYTRNSSIVSHGLFETGKQFRLPEMHLMGDLGLFESRCVFDPTVQIRDAREREGEVLVKTVQFKICGGLVVCAKESVGKEVAVPVGLLMLGRAKRGGRCCQSRYRVPGVEGRDYQ
ncbi:uncharacterized protein H6S33_012662 [Morchella sextelata]|uniref:uncharacterized protein n=1 Tax=Morchella sextelata TaxID=1174677 RepID=UPI001D03DB96|nr:uncharacterized protein H6S33_012662 [Morchella sextelata]KAH0610116.1 hypothetical protein H6S33_012662 [Morchella sextelata]